ncbi:MAG: hypothetical protein KTR16_05830 [Acidiferrobacterales bacterium]|nr:hypothetical protein [Acidiferrobacterales bacterium]
MSDVVINPVWVNTLDPERTALDQRFKRYLYELPFGGVHEGTTLGIGAAPPKSVLGKSHLVLETEYGYCALDNYRTIFQALLGIPFSKIDRKELARKLNLFLPHAPQEFIELFRHLTPNVYAKADPSNYTVRVRLMSVDASVSCNMSASVEFWQRLLNHSSFIQHKLKSSSKAEQRATVMVPLGEVTLGKKTLSELAVGDVVRLDNTHFDKSGLGSIRLGANTLNVRWQSRGITDNFLVISQESNHAD